MTGTFRAIRASKGEKAPQVEFANLTEADLMEGDVTVAVDYSTVNYKDGLALTGAAPIIRAWPLWPARSKSHPAALPASRPSRAPSAHSRHYGFRRHPSRSARRGRRA